MANDKTLEAVIKLKDEISKPLNEIQNELNDLSQTSKSVDSAMQDVQNATKNTGDGMAVAGMAMQQAGQQMVSWGKEIVGTLGEMVNTTREWTAEVSQQEFVMDKFDKSTQDVINSLAGNSEALALTEQQYKNNATAVASFYRSSGMTTKAIDAMLPKTMQLVNDMSAFADVDVDTAMSDFKSALVGNFNALDKYGVAVNVATINESEYAKTLGKTWDKMSLAEKQQAVLNETIRQSSDYYGLAQQEAGEYGKQSDYMNQTLKETVSALGESLLPLLVPIVQKISEMAQKVKGWAEENPKAAQTIMTIIAAVGAFLIVGGTLLTILGMAAIAMTSVSAAGGIMAVVIGAITSPVTIVMAVIAALIAIGVALYQNWDTICAKATELKNWVVSKWNELCTALAPIINFIKTLIQNKWNEIKTTVTVISTAIKTVVTAIWNGIKTVIGTIVSIIKMLVENKWNEIKTVVSVVGNAIKTVVTNVWNAIKTAISTIVSAIKSVVVEKWNAIKYAVKSVMDAIKNTAINAFNTVKGKISGVISEIKSAWQGLKDKITNNPIVATVKKVTESLSNAENGNHAAGLRRVPYNNYLANLHQGEAILPRRDADKWRQGKGKSDTPQISITMNGTIIREEADLDRFAEKLVRKLNQQKIIT